MEKNKLFKRILTVILSVAFLIAAMPTSVVKADEKKPSEAEFDGSKIVMCVYQPRESDYVRNVSYGTSMYYYGGKTEPEKYWKITESWKDKATGKTLTDKDRFQTGKTYIYTVEAYSPTYDFSARYGIGFNFFVGDIVWDSEPDKEVFQKSSDGFRMTFTAETTVKRNYNMGGIQIVFKNGRYGMPYSVAGPFLDTINMLGIFDRVIGVSGDIAAGSMKIDLDKDGDYDIFCKKADSFLQLTLIGSSVLDEEYEFGLSILAKEKADANKQQYYGMVYIEFQDSSGTGPASGSFNKGDATIDLTGGTARFPIEEAQDLATTLEYCIAFDKSIALVDGNDFEEVDIAVGVAMDLDKDGSGDIRLTMDDKYTTIIFSKEATSSIKGKAVINLKAETMELLEFNSEPYYSPIVVVFSKEEEAKAPTVNDPVAAVQKVGDVVAEGGASYTITNTEEGKQTVTYTKPESAKATSANIPDAIAIDNKQFKVTEIAPGAFKGNKKLKKITIGKNIVKIGSKAFYGCKNLKSLRIKTTSLTKKSVGGNAFKGIHPKAKVKVPKKKLKDYQKILKAKGIKGKDQKITK